MSDCSPASEGPRATDADVRLASEPLPRSRDAGDGPVLRADPASAAVVSSGEVHIEPLAGEDPSATHVDIPAEEKMLAGGEKVPGKVEDSHDPFEDAHGDTLGPLCDVSAGLPRRRSASALRSQDDTAAGAGQGPRRALSLARASAPPPSRLSRVSAPPNLYRTSGSTVITVEQSVRHVEEVPRRAVRAAVVVSWNALFMAVAEILIELLILGGAYPKLPFRLDFFFLTMLSALLGYQSLQGIRKQHFDTSINALMVAALVESALIAGDILYMVETHKEFPATVPTRMPFLVLTFVNLSLVSFLIFEMLQFHKREQELEHELSEEEA